MSSFKRSSKGRESGGSAPGVKPWLNCGLGMICTGLRELDELFGGGMPLGTLTLIELDQYSNYGKTLMAYNLAEGISIGHKCLVISFLKSSSVALMESLPFNINYQNSGTESSLFAMGEGNLSSSASSSLQIAHGYKKYVGKEFH